MAALNTRFCVHSVHQRWVGLAVVRGLGTRLAVNIPSRGVDRGFVSTVLYGDAFGTKVSGCYREGGR